MDDSCTRPGSIPFKWEICPGTPKHTRSASATASAKVAPKQLAPPPFMASPSPYSSPRVAYAARSASVSPSRRRHAGQPQRRPTAFIDLAPRASPTTPADAAASEAREAAAATTAYRCFPLPLLVRGRRGGKKGRSGSASGSSSSGSSFRSDGVGELGLRRSASSSSSSLPLPPGRRFAEARDEAEAATGWFF